MKAVLITSPGGPEVLQVQEVENPRTGDDEVLIKIGATALNRADTLQRKGSYPPPEGASPGRYVTEKGIVSAAGGREPLPGPRMRRHRRIRREERHPMEGGLYSLVNCLFDEPTVCRGNFPVGLVHFLFRLLNIKERGYLSRQEVEKLTFCKELGADVCINYKIEDFVARVKEETGGKGVDVILDNGGTITEANLGCMLARRLTVQAAGLRTRSPENKALIVSEVEKNVWPAITAGKVKPVVYKSFPLYEAAEAHRLMESSKHIGKILLIP
ncbi:hypothetical protein AAC387_Pa06g3205 [Persea americana]